MKYILVCGGVISGIGKGVISSSLGTILKSYGLAVTSIKIDPYLNIGKGLEKERGRQAEVESISSRRWEFVWFSEPSHMSLLGTVLCRRRHLLAL